MSCFTEMNIAYDELLHCRTVHCFLCKQYYFFSLKMYRQKVLLHFFLAALVSKLFKILSMRVCRSSELKRERIVSTNNGKEKGVGFSGCVTTILCVLIRSKA